MRTLEHLELAGLPVLVIVARLRFKTIVCRPVRCAPVVWMTEPNVLVKLMLELAVKSIAVPVTEGTVQVLDLLLKRDVIGSVARIVEVIPLTESSLVLVTHKNSIFKQESKF